MTGRTHSINCTNCGAGLEVIGGGRVTTKICSYCGAALDATEAFRVLEVFAGMERPDTPFRLGQSAEWDGATFTIIGTLGQREEWDGEVWTWAEHQLYSPTHGYGWLTYEDGHCTFTRKVRDRPDHFVTSAEVERSEYRPYVFWRGRRYGYYATTHWRTVFVEGEFNWRPERGASGVTVDLVGPEVADGLLHFVVTGGQREDEVEHSLYWPDAIAAFGAEPLRPARGHHPLRPTISRLSGFAAGWFALMAACALAIGLAVLSTQPAEQTLWRGLPPTLSFEVRDTERPTRLRIRQGLQNDYSGFEVGLIGPDGTRLADTYREISYYSGGSGEDSWTEGSRTTEMSFVPPEPGAYTLSVAPDPDASRPVDVTLNVAEGRRNLFWIAAAAVGFVVLAVATGFHRVHTSSRFRGSDWDDD